MQITYEIVIPNDEMIAFLDAYSFNLKKDLKTLNLTHKEIEDIIIDASINIETSLKGAPILGNQFVSMRKIDVNYGNSGVKRGLRLILFVLMRDRQLTLIHVYSKSKKKDMTKKEYKGLNELYDALLEG